MSRQLTERERKVIGEADLTLRVESVVRQQWRMSKAPNDASVLISISMQLFLPTISGVYAARAFCPGLLPAGIEGVAQTALIVFMLITAIALELVFVLTSKKPFNFGAISMLGRRNAWHTSYVRLMWLLLLASLAWSGQTFLCLMVIGSWLHSRYVLKLCQRATRRVMREIENHPEPMLIELN
jgi:hypothetical protein